MERDEQTGLLVPTFWEPPVGVDELAHVDAVNGEPTIFLMIASYRDWQCRDTAASALARATHPYHAARTHTSPSASTALKYGSTRWTRTTRQARSTRAMSATACTAARPLRCRSTRIVCLSMDGTSGSSTSGSGRGTRWLFCRLT